jgi:glucose/arabinose dehydrogenase
MTRPVGSRRAGPGGLGILPLILAGSITMARAADCTGIAPVPNTSLKGVAVASGLPGRPLYVTAPPGDRDRIFIVEQDGFIRIKKRGHPPDQISTFLDISTVVQATRTSALDEMGLLGMAFDPGYAANGFLYVDYTEGPLNGPWFTVVARYSVSSNDPDAADPGSELRILRFAQPQANHNGGQVQFGPDGYLYVSTGDGGGANDQGSGHAVCGNGQGRSTLLGKMLRLDVHGIAPAGLNPDCGGASAPYRVPADNPFADGAGGACDEIWAVGLRNPWRSAFDAANGDLYIADVGQNCWEEVNYTPGAQAAGRNYGWRQMEGTHCFNASMSLNCNPPGVACGSSPACLDPLLTLPVLEFAHTGGACSITGGLVYRGCLMPDFSGAYFYGDYCAGFVRSFRMAGGTVTDERDWTGGIDPGATLVNSLTSFGQDADGEIYITDRGGTVFRILPPFTDLEVSGKGSADPLRLDATGWRWENLENSTMHPVSHYRVFRGRPGGAFTCIFTTPVPEWIGGDPAVPAPGAMHAYVVTAVSPGGEETHGVDPPQTLDPAACP